jgi:hypothetical protein
MRAVFLAALWLCGCHILIGYETAPPDTPRFDRDGAADLRVHDGPGRDLVRDASAPDGPKAKPLRHAWSKRFGTASSDYGSSVAVDGSGNVLVVGAFQGTVDFGGGPVTGGGYSDIFVASYTSGGAFRWAKRFGASGYDEGFGVGVDGSGNVTVTGFFAGTVDFGGGGLTSAGDSDIVVVSYTSSGAFRWAKRFGGTGSDTGYAVAVDGNGNLVVTGTFQGTVDFGGGPLACAGISDIFVASYTSAGAFRWAKRFGASSYAEGHGVGVDSSGNATVTGAFSGTADFGGGPLVGAGVYDIFVASYTSTGAFRWAKHFGGTSYDGGLGVAVDKDANVTVTGYFAQTVDFGGGPFTSAGSNDSFVASYTSTGGFRWAKRFGATMTDAGRAIAVDGSGDLVVTGNFSESVDFGAGLLKSAGIDDIFIASYSSAGAFRSAARFGSAGSDASFGIAVDNAGRVVATGYFSDTMDLGGGPLASAGLGDIFLLQLTP